MCSLSINPLSAAKLLVYHQIKPITIEKNLQKVKGIITNCHICRATILYACDLVEPCLKNRWSQNKENEIYLWT